MGEEIKSGTHRFDIEPEFVSQNMVVHVVENYGQVVVTHTEEDGSGPIQNAYVKAYARMRNGSVRFWHDVYTDHRGRADYATISGGDVGDVDRFAVLVMTEECGCVVKEARPPRT